MYQESLPYRESCIPDAGFAILTDVLRYLHALSAVLFYALGTSFFGAYFLMQNEIGATFPYMWLQVGDLPLFLSGVLYGGISVYRSLQGDAPVSRVLAIAIGLPLLFLFVAIAILNFLPGDFAA